MSSVVRWLHLSDFHFSRGEDYDANIVLEALLRDLPSIGKEREFLPVDLVFVTGDIASSGNEREYELAAQFLHRLLCELDVSADRLYIVPGNHDVDWTRIGIAAAIDAYISAPDLPHINVRARTAELLNDYEGRALMLRRLAGYSDFINTSFPDHPSLTSS